MSMAALATVVPPAAADVPDNDSWQSATEVTTLPFEDSVDTTEATTDPDSPPGLGRYHKHTVWYHLDLADDSTVLISGDGTDYQFKVMLFQADSATQTPDQWTKVRGSRRVGFIQELKAATDYFVGIGARQRGGLAHLVVRAPAQVEVTVNDTADYDPVDGSALLAGTISSDQPTLVYLQLQLKQLVGQRVVQAVGNKKLEPSSDPTAWEMRMSGEYGFKLGPARLITNRIFAYDAGVRIRPIAVDRDTVTLE